MTSGSFNIQHSTFNSYSAYSGGASSRSARMSRITRRRFSTSVRSPTTSVVEIDCLGESRALLDADPVCESRLGDVAIDSDGAGCCVPPGTRVASRRAFVDRSGDGDMPAPSYTPISPAPIPENPAVAAFERVATGV